MDKNIGDKNIGKETVAQKQDRSYCFEELVRMSSVGEEALEYAASLNHVPGEYTIEDYRALPEDQRVELIDGYFFKMEAPTYNHQEIAGEIHRQIANYIYEHQGACRPVISPVDVQLDCDNKTMVQPDVGILCDKDKIRRWGIYGAPDFLLEVVSLSSRTRDYTKKLAKYEQAGVREYWIFDPYQKRVLVYYFQGDSVPIIYGLDKPIPVNIFGGKLEIDLSRIHEWIQEQERMS